MYRKIIDSNLTGHKLNEFFYSIINCLKATKESHCDRWAMVLLDKETSNYIRFLIKNIDENVNLENFENYCYNLSSSNVKLSANSIILRINILLDAEFGKYDVITYDMVYKYLTDGWKPNNFEDNIIKSIANYYIIFTEENCCRNEYSVMSFYMIDKISSALYPALDFIRNVRKIYKHDLNKKIYTDDIEYLCHRKPKIGKITIENNLVFIDIAHIYGAWNSTSTAGNDGTDGIIVRNLSEYINAVNRIIFSQQEHDSNHLITVNNKLWFRGVCHSEFSLMPSLFRKLKHKCSVYSCQADIVKYIYFLTSNLSELWTQPIEQQMSCLQHYGAPTNLLDFTIDMLAALHFAITPDKQEDMEKIDTGLFQPVVYIFDTLAYSNAINILKGSQEVFSFSPIETDINTSYGKKSKYFINDVSFEYLVKHTENFNKNTANIYNISDYPLPIIIKRSQPRIAAQNGMFVAFPLDAYRFNNTETCDVTEDMFKYLDLRIIHLKYEDFLSQNGQNDLVYFLKRIYIKNSCVKQIKQELENLNISSYKYYPELSNIIKGGIDKYFQN